jgi:hypothetical protein
VHEGARQHALRWCAGQQFFLMSHRVGLLVERKQLSGTCTAAAAAAGEDIVASVPVRQQQQQPPQQKPIVVRYLIVWTRCQLAQLCQPGPAHLPTTQAMMAAS